MRHHGFAISFVLLSLAGCGRSGVDPVPGPRPEPVSASAVATPAPGDSALVAATSDSSSATRACPVGLICFLGRTGPYTGHPVFVIDGVVYETIRDSLGMRATVPDLAPEQIEAIEVVKGAQAVARFGPAARDGAILIRTKRQPAPSPSPP